ncbi:ead/Ea22-like family protein [Enterobacter ludwigii]|uniref:ead/Ea22-like family protein n=1 Tax=Enterobacter ludwigii TaxID=299767 RepID=UPI003C30616F
MSNIDKQALRWKAEKATQGEWWSDSCGNEGTYGSGDDCVEGFTSYAVYDENNQILLDTLNSTAACINEEYDGEGHVAWDEVGQRNAEFVAAANPATVLALLDELEAKDRRNSELTEALKQTVSGYKFCLRMGHDRILDLGGDCDSPEVMIAGNPDIQQAEKLIAAAAGKGEQA